MPIEAFNFATIEPLHERLCLDFTNSTPYHFGLDSDHLNSYADLISWSLDAGLLNEDQVLRLVALAARQQTEADTVFDQAITLREAIYRVFSAIAQDMTPDLEDLDTLNNWLSQAMLHLRLELGTMVTAGAGPTLKISSSKCCGGWPGRRANCCGRMISSSSGSAMARTATGCFWIQAVTTAAAGVI